MLARHFHFQPGRQIDDGSFAPIQVIARWFRISPKLPFLQFSVQLRSTPLLRLQFPRLKHSCWRCGCRYALDGHAHAATCRVIGMREPGERRGDGPPGASLSAPAPAVSSMLLRCCFPPRLAMVPPLSTILSSRVSGDPRLFASVRLGDIAHLQAKPATSAANGIVFAGDLRNSSR